MKKSAIKPIVRQHTPKEAKMMKIINISVLCFIGATLLGLVACALNGLGEIACILGFVIVVMLWNWNVIRRKYARGV